MLKPRVASAESAEAKSLDQVAQNSTTASVAINVSEGYQKALQFAALWLGSTEEVVYQLNTDYNPTGMSPQEQLAAFAQLQGGGISRLAYFNKMKKGEFYESDVKFEDEMKRISEDNLESDI